jgi:hypothetical protein
MDAVKGL